jgi:hypothetical protein
MATMNGLEKYDPEGRATDINTGFAFGVAVGALIPLLVIALSAN